MSDHGQSREELTQRANQTRTMLLQTVEQLDLRRHEAVDLRARWQRLFWRVSVAGAILLLATGGAVALFAQRMTSGPGRRRRGRWRLLKQRRRQSDSAIVIQFRPLLYDIARAVLLPILAAAARSAFTPKRDAPR